MTIIHFGLDLYFAAILSVSGLAKVEHPALFAATLRKQHLLPAQSVAGASYVVPWAELVLAVMLVLGLVPAVTSGLVLGLFCSFLIVDVVLLTTKRSVDCGCYGNAHARKADSASVVTATVLVCLAALHAWTGIMVTPMIGALRPIAGVFLLGGEGWLGWCILRRRASDKLASRYSTNAKHTILDYTASGPRYKQSGDALPVK